MVISITHNTATKNVEKSGENKAAERPYGLAWALITLFEAVDVNGRQIKTEIANLSENADSQDAINALIADIKYKPFPKSKDGKPPTSEEIEAVNNENTQLHAVCSNYESQLVTIRQRAKVNMTNTQATIANSQTLVAETANQLNIQNTVAKKIATINERVN